VNKLNPDYAIDFVMRKKRAKNMKKHGNFLPQMYFLYIEDKKLSTFSGLKSFFFVINFYCVIWVKMYDRSYWTSEPIWSMLETIKKQ